MVRVGEEAVTLLCLHATLVVATDQWINDIAKSGNTDVIYNSVMYIVDLCFVAEASNALNASLPRKVNIRNSNSGLSKLFVKQNLSKVWHAVVKM